MADASLRSLFRDAQSIAYRVSNAATNFTREDRGGCVAKTDTGTYTHTIPNDATAGWDDNASIIAANDGPAGSGNLTIAPGASVTLTAGTTTGSLVLAPGESRLLHRTGANTWRAR